MFGFILGAVAGAAGYWAYQRYVVGSDDDAFADFETSSLDRPTTTDFTTRSSDTTASQGSTTPSSTTPSSSTPS
jgi:hypothetical protein